MYKLKPNPTETKITKLPMLIVFERDGKSTNFSSENTALKNPAIFENVFITIVCWLYQQIKQF